MPLNVRSIAANTAVICFFATSLIGWNSGLSPFTCCKRALAGAMVAYVTAVLAVKVINAILINAMINSRMNQQRGKADGSGN